MLKIENLHVEVEGKKILEGLNLEVGPGEIHAIMGPNGVGKSTLSKILAGHPSCSKVEGNIFFQGKDLFSLSIEERSLSGLFVSFQNPPEIPGVSEEEFLRTIVQAKQKWEKRVEGGDFLSYLEKKIEELGMKRELLTRSLNEGFSGGERKRNEVLQLLLLSPHLAILDEIDSGLDIDALKRIAKSLLLWKDEQKSLVLITHYPRLLKEIPPDYVHILMNGKIVKSGNSRIIDCLESEGYDGVVCRS